MTLPARFKTVSAWMRDPLVLFAVTMAALALAGRLTRRPFWGIVHDNRLYAVQALRYNNPDVFNDDLFFRYGSQDSFTLFSPIYAWLIRLVGLDAATMALTAAGQLLWIVAAVALVRAILPRPYTWLALLLIATYGTVYGGNFVFSLAEGFATPRLFAEALSLAAIAAFLGTRHVLAAGLIILAALLHPLMAAPPAAALILMAAFRNGSWRAPLLLIAAGTAALIAFLAVVHLARLPFPPMIDPEWKFIAGTRSVQLLISKWSAVDWLSTVGDGLILVIACFAATPVIRQLLAITVALAASSILLSYVGFDLLDNLLLGQLQIWRTTWLLRALAPIAMTLIIYDICLRNTPQRRTLLGLCLVVCFVIAVAASAGIPSLGLPCALLLAVLFFEDRRKHDDQAFRRLVSAVCGFTGAVIAVAAILMLFKLYDADNRAQDPLLSNYAPLEIIPAFIPVGVLVLGFFIFLRRSASPVWAVVAAGILLYGAWNWDQREPWRRYMDSAPDINAELSRPVAPDEVVYWPGNIMGVWGALERKSYFAPIQGAGSIFNRETALEFLRLLKSARKFEVGSSWATQFLGVLAPAEEGTDISEKKVEKSDLAALCSEATPPDVVVISQKIDGVPSERWIPMTGQPYSAVVERRGDTKLFARRYAKEFYFYRCSDLPGVKPAAP